MQASDWIIDLGPKAGVYGGNIVYNGNTKNLYQAKNSLTADYLLNKKIIQCPKSRRLGNGHMITINGADGNNLKKITCDFPLGKFICITGVSGSGKSSLIIQTLIPILMQKLHSSKTSHLNYHQISGYEYIDKVIAIDQSPTLIDSESPHSTAVS